MVAAVGRGDNTSDAGGLLLDATDRAIGLVRRFAACFADGRARGHVEHTIEAMVAQRVFGYCQSNANWSPKRPKPEISGRQLTPPSQGGGAVLFEDGAAGEVAIETEMVVDRGVNGGEF